MKTKKIFLSLNIDEHLSRYYETVAAIPVLVVYNILPNIGNNNI